MTQNGHEVFDLSDLGSSREKIRLTDGLEYEILGPSDMGPILGARFARLAGEAGREDGDEIQVATRQEASMKEQAKLVCPDMPADMSFQICAGIVARFLVTVQDQPGLSPKVQEMFDKLKTEPETAAEAPQTTQK